MELVYLWVEEYKNIKNQGFNFSPGFECEFFPKYDKYGKLEDNCELRKTPKDYVSIFPKNINITAIVGENGSGKSSVLDLINNDGYENPKVSPYPIIHYNLKTINIYYNKKENKLYFDTRNLNVIIENKTKIKFEKKEIDYKQTIFIKPIPKHDYEEKVSLLNFRINNPHIGYPFNFPNIINFGIHDDFSDLLESIENTNFDFHSTYSPFEEDKEKRFKIFHILLLLSFIHNHNLKVNIQASEDFKTTISDLENIIEVEIRNQINNFINIFKNFLEEYSHNTDNFINIENLNKDFFKIYIDVIKRKNDTELLPYKGKKVFNFDLHPKMSDGQYQLTYLFNNIYSQINNETIVLLIDEGENFLHPNWQKKYINYLLKFLEVNFKEKTFHIILSSHSPFILSDLPKENVIFIGKYKKDEDKDQKEGNCKNVTKHIELKTFGANIHTLLSNGFFMSNGLMGEFAKGK